MTADADPGSDQRILLLLPFGGDARMGAETLRKAGLEPCVCEDMDRLADGIDEGAGAALIEEEALLGSAGQTLEAALSRQPPWSSLPLLVLARPGGVAPGMRPFLARLDASHGMTLLQRPVPTLSLISALRVSLAARRRQYELRNTLERLDEAVKQRDRFLAMLAHELRNPMGPIMNAAELLGARPDSPETARWAADMIGRQTRHLARLAADLLDVSRVIHGRVELNREPVDLGGLVRDAAEGMGPQIARRGQVLALSLPEGGLWVDADPVRLTQVLSNLLDNASKYSGEGGRIRVGAERAEGRATVRVRDEGRGIAPERLPHIVDVFFRVESGAAPGDGGSGGGLGLGLSLVRSLVELHGGRVEARSEGPGAGTEIRFDLPLRETEAPQKAPREALHPQSGPPAPRRVLVVEDNDAVAEAFAGLLKALGFAVRIARSGEEALAAADEEQPEVAFIDRGLPDMPGDEVARRLRQRLPRPCTLAALSGYDPSHLDGAGASPFDHYLVKPATTDDVLRVLAPPEKGT